jgi:hypothetical protein
MFVNMRYTLAWALCVVGLVVRPAAAPAQPLVSRSSQRLVALQQQNAFQQQQSAVQNAVQQTAILVQTAFQQNSVSTPVLVTPANFQQQQAALRTALQQTTALLQASQARNPGLSRSALGQLNTLQGVLQQSISLQTALQIQNNVFTPAQLLMLAQEQPSLSSLLTTQVAPLPNQMPGGRTH